MSHKNVFQILTIFGIRFNSEVLNRKFFMINPYFMFNLMQKVTSCFYAFVPTLPVCRQAGGRSPSCLSQDYDLCAFVF